MKVVFLTENNQNEVIREAVDVLAKGGSIVYPTDTVYGLGVNPFDDFAVRRLFRIKKRPSGKPVPLMVKSIAMAKKLAYLDERKEKILQSLWPGAVNVVLYARDLVSPPISAHTKTVALRIPANDFCIALLRAVNCPLTSTSANISGEDAASDAKKITQRFKEEIYMPDLVIDAGKLEVSQPSTVLDLTGSKPRVLRAGPVKAKDLAHILEV
ncbi:MAG: threonylcarbamoyl-AMP synthase [Candidatus Spechtbacteria bacterium]|nr:threonylcarbamoyl-AMP synthase [Candidatus Spechtbacteria bacterium]